MTLPLLTIKIGNSNITFGVFENSTLVARWRIHTEADKTADEYAILLEDLFSQSLVADHHWRGIVIVSVVPPLTTTFQELCRHHFETDPLIAGPGVKTGMPIRYDNPLALGTDRLVEAVAAKAKFGAPVIVIDFGTATTFNAVNRVGEFVGGAIAPGLDLAADALHRATAQLPRVDLAMPPRVISTNTTHAMQSGILFGYIGMIEGMIARMRDELREPNARVVATGGLASMLAPYTRVIQSVEPELILDGLRIIYEMN
ncbi:MAG: type III pantothenate kinase [Chloroflexi bacterium]|nr:type III pantothenate kinase [Chloroflexota bacterium]